MGRSGLNFRVKSDNPDLIYYLIYLFKSLIK